jgi:hypothetical protein
MYRVRTVIYNLDAPHLPCCADTAEMCSIASRYITTLVPWRRGLSCIVDGNLVDPGGVRIYRFEIHLCTVVLCICGIQVVYVCHNISKSVRWYVLCTISM